jgi:hypothetical protein
LLVGLLEGLDVSENIMGDDGTVAFQYDPKI